MKMIKTRKSLDGDVTQHCFVAKKYSISPTVPNAIWIRNQMIIITK